MMRLAIYGFFSTALFAGVILSAAYQHSNFYSACIYLSKSSTCMMIMINMGLILTWIFAKGLQAIFLGPLRAIEIEHLYERSWYAITETCLAMNIFREEFDLRFIVYLGTLSLLKIFHWLCQDRIEFMEQSPVIRTTFHARIVSLMSLLLTIDVVLANHAIRTSMLKEPSMMIMFAFEYMVLTCTLVSTIGKYIINLIDMRSEQTWEGKSMFVFYLDLVTDFVKLAIYLLFFVYICINFQIPLHIVRDIYITFRSFVQKCTDLYRYRRATRNMNELYPDATSEDFSRSNDSTCIICREEMHPVATTGFQDEPVEANLNRQEQELDKPKKLPCGHVFHFHCLRSWLERQQTCPTCRRSVLTDNNTTPAPTENNDPVPEPAPAMPAPANPTEVHTADHNAPPMPAPGDFPNGLGSTAFPGMIPLTPLLGNTTPFTPEALPEQLSESQIQRLSEITRQSLEEKLRLLGQVQGQIFHSMQILTQVLSVTPSSPIPQPSGSSFCNNNEGNPGHSDSSHDNTTHNNNYSDHDNNDNSSHDDSIHNDSSSHNNEKQKEKMADRSQLTADNTLE